MIGQFFAILTGLGFAASSVFMRQAVYRTRESTTSVFVSILLGTIIFSIVLIISGNANQLTTASWKAISAFAGSGVIIFILGRWLHYHSLRLIGANRGGPLLNSSNIVAVILGVTLMDERFTWSLALGVLFIVTGVVLVSSESTSEQTADVASMTRDLAKGVAAGLSAGICYGIGPVLTKFAIEEGNSPYTGIFISYVTAMLLILIHRMILRKLAEVKLFYKKAIAPMSLGALSTSIAQLCRYLSLDYISVSIVLPLNSTSTLFTILLSFVINRRIELFTWKIIVGAILVVTGVFFIFQV